MASSHCNKISNSALVRVPSAISSAARSRCDSVRLLAANSSRALSVLQIYIVKPLVQSIRLECVERV